MYWITRAFIQITLWLRIVIHSRPIFPTKLLSVAYLFQWNLISICPSRYNANGCFVCLWHDLWVIFINSFVCSVFHSVVKLYLLRSRFISDGISFYADIFEFYSIKQTNSCGMSHRALWMVYWNTTPLEIKTGISLLFIVIFHSFYCRF